MAPGLKSETPLGVLKPEVHAWWPHQLPLPLVSLPPRQDWVCWRAMHSTWLESTLGPCRTHPDTAAAAGLGVSGSVACIPSWRLWLFLCGHLSMGRCGCWGACGQGREATGSSALGTLLSAHWAQRKCWRGLPRVRGSEDAHWQLTGLSGDTVLWGLISLRTSNGANSGLILSKQDGAGCSA